MPFVLVEALAAICESSGPSQHDRPKIGHVDAAARRIPVGAPDGIWVEQEKQPTILVEEENASHGTLDDGCRLHSPPDRHDRRQATGSGLTVADAGSRSVTPALASVRECTQWAWLVGAARRGRA